MRYQAPQGSSAHEHRATGARFWGWNQRFILLSLVAVASCLWFFVTSAKPESAQAHDQGTIEQKL